MREKQQIEEDLKGYLDWITQAGKGIFKGPPFTYSCYCKIGTIFLISFVRDVTSVTSENSKLVGVDQLFLSSSKENDEQFSL